MSTSKIARSARIATGIVLSLLGASAWGHHSFAAIFDESESEVTGVLKRVEWINPHSYFYVDVKNPDGTVVTWAFENFPPAMLRRLGISRDMLTAKIGSTVVVSYSPAHKKGQPLGYGRVFAFEGGPRIVFTPPNASGSAPVAE